MKRYNAYVFDMDGTVLNTLEDLKISINYALEKTGHRHDFGDDIVGLLFGSAVRVAVTRALALEKGFSLKEIMTAGTPEDMVSKEIDTAELERILEIYRPHYQLHCDDHTKPYEGIPELVRFLNEQGCRTAVVSNKPDPAVQKLNEVHFGGVFEAVIGESPLYARKPAPDMVLRALEMLEVKAEEAVYIGDTEVDLQTAANCGMDCITVSWGFRPRAYLEALGAEPIIDSAWEITAPFE